MTLRRLLDEQLSPLIATELRNEGYDAVSVHALNLAGQPDPIVFGIAPKEGRVVVIQDFDFNALQQLSRLSSEGVILLRANQPSTKTLLALLRRFLREHGETSMRGRVASVGSTTRFHPSL